MIEASILRAMLAAGATAEMIVVAVEAAIEADRAKWRKRKMSQRQVGVSHSVSETSIPTPLRDNNNIKNISQRGTGRNSRALGTNPRALKTNPRASDEATVAMVDSFNQFWVIYPRREAKRAALKAFKHALNRAGVEDILAGAKRYEAECRGREKQYIKQPTTWLNADCWLDEQQKVVEFRNPPKRTWAEIQADKARAPNQG